MNDQHPPRRRPFQFRLRTLFIVTAVVAIVLSGLFAPSDYARFVSAETVTLAIPVSLTTLLVYRRGYVRTFCVGGLLPSAGVVFSDPMHIFWPVIDAFVRDELVDFEEQAAQALAGLVLVLVLTIAMGLLAMGVRWLVESSNRADTQ